MYYTVYMPMRSELATPSGSAEGVLPPGVTQETIEIAHIEPQLKELQLGKPSFLSRIKQLFEVKPPPTPSEVFELQIQEVSARNPGVHVEVLNVPK
jgi:hypothetical protein